MNDTTTPTAPAGPVQSMVQCWDCEGGTIALAFPSAKGPVEITCPRCKGTGHCPEIMRAWEAKGAEIKAARLARGVSLRAYAKEIGVYVVIVSYAERGIIDPATLNSELTERGSA